MPLQSNDFVVVGGGPAGCAFAILAARAGASVVLIERDDYRQPRPGEHLAGRIRPMLDALRVSRDDTTDMADFSPGICSSWTGDVSLLKLYGASAQAVGLRVLRNRFDELLWRTARDIGVSLVSGRLVRVERLRTREWSLAIEETQGRARALVAPSIVDATGRCAAVARRQGAQRINHGDLVAIVRWLDARDVPQHAETMLMVESCEYGWWSLSTLPNSMLAATFYTSLGMMRAARATPERWWTHALGATEDISDVVSECRSDEHAVTRVYRCCPSRSSRVVGDCWIAIGDAAIALDPLAGQGVALAVETGFRAFEAARADPSWSSLARHYSDALLSRFQTHLAGRTRVYREAAGVLSPSFVGSAVMERAADVA